jgi:hypothetical protein
MPVAEAFTTKTKDPCGEELQPRLRKGFLLYGVF